MGKSLHNAISFDDDADARWAKLASAVTDPARRRREDPGTPERCPMYTLHQHVSSVDTCREVADGCRRATIGCIECKGRLNDGITALFEPVQLRRRELAGDPGRVRQVLGDGAAVARRVVRETRDAVQDRLGIVRYGNEEQR